MKHLYEKGEVATILAISAVIVIGISMISSAFFGGKKQSTNSRASVEICRRTLSPDCRADEYYGEDADGRPACCRQVAETPTPTPPPNTGHGPIPDDGIPTDSPTSVPVNIPTTQPQPTQPTTDPVGSGGQPTTAPPSNTSSGLCGGNYAACTSNCGSGNDCVKYLKSVTVPGLNDGDVVNTDTFDCDIVTTNVDGARTDRDNICGVKVNGQWPGWCPWNGVLQDTCGATISSRANCNLKSDWFNKNTPVKAGDKLQVVAARKVGSCGNIPWSTAGSFITGPTFYYKQKGGSGGGGATSPTSPPGKAQPTIVSKQPESTTNVNNLTKCPGADNTWIEEGKTFGNYKCCKAHQNPKDLSLNYASWNDQPKCKDDGATATPTSGVGGCQDFGNYCVSECSQVHAGWSCMGEKNNYCCPNPNTLSPTKGAIIQTLSVTPTQSIPPPLVLTGNPFANTPTPASTARVSGTPTTQPAPSTATGITSPTVEPTKFCANPKTVRFPKESFVVKIGNGKGQYRQQDITALINEDINSASSFTLGTVNSINEFRSIQIHNAATSFFRGASAALSIMAKQIDTSGVNYIGMVYDGKDFGFTISGGIDLAKLIVENTNSFFQNINLPISGNIEGVINTICN